MPQPLHNPNTEGEGQGRDVGDGGRERYIQVMGMLTCFGPYKFWFKHKVKFKLKFKFSI